MANSTPITDTYHATYVYLLCPYSSRAATPCHFMSWQVSLKIIEEALRDDFYEQSEKYKHVLSEPAACHRR
jgi:hypothetical protein